MPPHPTCLIRVAAVLGMVAASSVLRASPPAAGPLKNWYNDPFFAVRQGIAHCPMPLGPLTTEADSVAQAHWRAERGTSCWLAGQCQKPNAYLYDAEIGADLQRRFRRSHGFAHATLWVTVQRRFVYVEGCVARRQAADALTAFVRRTPNVELAVVHVVTLPARPNYAVLPPP